LPKEPACTDAEAQRTISDAALRTYHDSTKAVIDGTVAATYSVSSDTPTTVAVWRIGTVTANAGNPDGLSSGTQTNCYRVDASGNVTFFKVTVSVNGVTLTFQ